MSESLDQIEQIDVEEPTPIILSEDRRSVIYAIPDKEDVITFGQTLKRPKRLRSYGVALVRAPGVVELRVPLVSKNPREFMEFKAEVEKYLFAKGITKAYGYTDENFGRALRVGMAVLGKNNDGRIRRSPQRKQVGQESLEQWVWNLDEDPTNN